VALGGVVVVLTVVNVVSLLRARRVSARSAHTDNAHQHAPDSRGYERVRSELSARRDRRQQIEADLDAALRWPRTLIAGHRVDVAELADGVVSHEHESFRIDDRLTSSEHAGVVDARRRQLRARREADAVERRRVRAVGQLRAHREQNRVVGACIVRRVVLPTRDPHCLSIS
jgi:hypothetical protein